MIWRRFGLGVAMLAGTLAMASVGLGLDLFAPPNAADAVWLRLLGGMSAVAFACAGIAAVVLVAVGRWRHRRGTGRW